MFFRKKQELIELSLFNVTKQLNKYAAVKEPKNYRDKTLLIVDFDSRNGDSEFIRFNEKIKFILANAANVDEVLLNIHSPGGSVALYAAAAAKVKSIENMGIRVTAMVDEVAASGGYLMASQAHKIVCNSMALVGSVGVVASFHNFSHLMSNHGVGYEVYTAGDCKRSVTPFTDNSEDAINIFKDDLERIHTEFKHLVKVYRDIDDQYLEGSVYHGRLAKEHKMVDDLKDSNEVIMDYHHNKYKIYQIKATGLHNIANNTSSKTASIVDRIIDRIFERICSKTTTINAIR